MTYFRDLAPCDYFDDPTRIVAVGWLEGNRPFSTGAVPPYFRQKLGRLLEHAWQPCLFRGQHECTIAMTAS